MKKEIQKINTSTPIIGTLVCRSLGICGVKRDWGPLSIKSGVETDQAAGQGCGYGVLLTTV